MIVISVVNKQQKCFKAICLGLRSLVAGLTLICFVDYISAKLVRFGIGQAWAEAAQVPQPGETKEPKGACFKTQNKVKQQGVLGTFEAWCFGSGVSPGETCRTRSARGSCGRLVEYAWKGVFWCVSRSQRIFSTLVFNRFCLVPFVRRLLRTLRFTSFFFGWVRNLFIKTRRWHVPAAFWKGKGDTRSRFELEVERKSSFNPMGVAKILTIWESMRILGGYIKPAFLA